MLPADISTLLAAVAFWIIAPGSRRLSYSSPLAAVNCVDHIHPTCLLENWAPRTIPIPAWCRTGPQGTPPYQPGENTRPLGPPATSWEIGNTSKASLGISWDRAAILAPSQGCCPSPPWDTARLNVVHAFPLMSGFIPSCFQCEILFSPIGA